MTDKPSLSKWFAETANWFILFVRTYEEQRVAERLQGALDTERYTVFVPMKDYAYHKQGRTLLRKVPWIKGYVFIAATVGEEECLAAVDRLTHNDEDVFRFLRNGGKDGSAKLNEHDRALMRAILDENFNIPALETVEVGGRLMIADGSPFSGIGGEIIKVDRHRQTATVAVLMLGATIEYTVALAEAYTPPPARNEVQQ